MSSMGKKAPAYPKSLIYFLFQLNIHCLAPLPPQIFHLHGIDINFQCLRKPPQVQHNFILSKVFLCFCFSIFGCATWHVGLLFPHQGSNQHPLYWKLRVFTTRPPWKTLPAALLSEVSVTHGQPWSKILSGKSQK